MSQPPSIAEWDARPFDAFAAFVATPEFVLTSSRQSDPVPLPISAESATIYKFMFGKFATWMLEHGLRMSTVNAATAIKRTMDTATSGTTAPDSLRARAISSPVPRPGRRGGQA